MNRDDAYQNNMLKLSLFLSFDLLLRCLLASFVFSIERLLYPSLSFEPRVTAFEKSRLDS